MLGFSCFIWNSTDFNWDVSCLFKLQLNILVAIDRMESMYVNCRFLFEISIHLPWEDVFSINFIRKIFHLSKSWSISEIEHCLDDPDTRKTFHNFGHGDKQSNQTTDIQISQPLPNAKPKFFRDNELKQIFLQTCLLIQIFYTFVLLSVSNIFKYFHREFVR